jgi:deoxyribose-phosphate aldolase
VGVKASGGIRTVDEALAMIRAGADRIGTSAAATWTGALGPGAPSLADLLR